MPPAPPAVSVLLPVFDAGTTLGDCLRSLGRQSLDDFEIVAVDDGSRDDSLTQLTSWARRDTRLRIVERPHEGLIPTLNAGLAACRGPLVARMDADDIAHPRRFELQRAVLAGQPEVGVVSCLVSHFPRPAIGEGFRVYERWLNRLVEPEAIARERFVESPLPHPSVMFRRELVAALGGYRERGWPEDYDLWLRLAARGVRFSKVPKVLLAWRDHPDRLTRADRRYAVERFLACKAHHLARGPLAGRPAVVWGAGQTGRRLSKHLLREGVEITAFVDIDAAKIGRTVRRRPVVAGEDLPGLLRVAPPPVVLSAVSSRGARALIRTRLERLGLVEGAGFWCVA